MSPKSLIFFWQITVPKFAFDEWISGKILACSWNNSNETAFNQTWALKILKLWFDWSKWNPLFCIWAVLKLIIYQPLWRLLQVRNPSCHQTSSIIRRFSYATCWPNDPAKSWKVKLLEHVENQIIISVLIWGYLRSKMPSLPVKSSGYF